MASWLETEKGDVIPLHGFCTIGREENNHIVLTTSAVSRHHAALNERDGDFWIVDLGSVNGLKVNGTRVTQPVRLQAGDRILLPSIYFIYQRGVLPAPVVPPQEPKPEPKPEQTEPAAPVAVPVAVPEEVRPVPARAIFDENAANNLRGRKKKRLEKKAKKIGNDDALLTQKLEVASFPQDKPSLFKDEDKKQPAQPTALKAVPTIAAPAVAQLASAMEIHSALAGVEKKVETPEQFAFEVAPVISVPAVEKLAPAIEIHSAPVEVNKEPEATKPFAFEVAPIIDVPGITQLAPAIEIHRAAVEVEKKKEAEKPFAFQLAPVIAVPAEAKLVPAIEIHRAAVEVERKKGAEKSFAFQVAPVVGVAAEAQIVPDLFDSPALVELELKREPLRPIAVKPASVNAPPILKKLPPPLPTLLPKTSTKGEAAPEAAAKVGPILIHPELVKELPLAPAPVVATPAPDLKKEGVLNLEPKPVVAPVEEKKEPAPVTTPEPVVAKTEDAKASVSSLGATSVPVPAAALEEKVKDKEANESKEPLFIPTTRTLVLVNANPQTMCVMAKRSMYIGLASIFLPFLGLITAIVAIFLGHRALKLIKQSNGYLLGRDQAVMGLYFGYITLGLIMAYSSFFYFFYASPNPSAFTTEAPTTLTYDPTIEIPAKPGGPAAATDNGQKTQSPAVVTPLQPTPAKASVPSIAVGTPTAPSPETLSPANLSVSPQASGESVPVVNQQNIPDKAPEVPDATVNSIGVKPPSPNPAPNPTAPPVNNENAATQSPPVFSYEQQERLKDQMLALPMPYASVDSTDYQDADAFNNSARILARKPEAKYAQSVQDFLDDVKARNPDHTRLQILETMYENYMAGLDNGESQ